MKKVFLFALMAVVLLVCVACAQPVAGEVIKSDKERVATPDVSQTDLTTLTAGNSAFALDLYQALKGADGNLFYSPYSISRALAEHQQFSPLDRLYRGETITGMIAGAGSIGMGVDKMLM